MNGGETGITTTAEVMEFARDIGRTWGDLHEIFVWEDGVKLVDNTLYYFQAIHQESDVVPENVDAIGALMGTESDWMTSVRKTDEAIARMILLMNVDVIELKRCMCLRISACVNAYHLHNTGALLFIPPWSGQPHCLLEGWSLRISRRNPRMKIFFILLGR